MIASNPQIFVTKRAIPAKDLKELLVWVKANQDKAIIGSGGAGTPSARIAAPCTPEGHRHAAADRPLSRRGAGDADLLAGQIDLFFDQAANALPQIRGGRIKPYAVTAKTRLLAAPEIPTVDEAGLPGFYMAVWHGIWLPGGAPKAIAARLNAAIMGSFGGPGSAPAPGRSRPGNSAARAAVARGATGSPQGRDQQVVAGDQGGRHQGGIRRRVPLESVIRQREPAVCGQSARSTPTRARAARAGQRDTLSFRALMCLR